MIINNKTAIFVILDEYRYLHYNYYKHRYNYSIEDTSVFNEDICISNRPDANNCATAAPILNKYF